MSDWTQDRIEIQDVMLRYAAGADERNLELYRSCFADDCEIVGFGKETVHGADNWVAYVTGALERYRVTQHQMGPVYAEIDGDVAEARTDVQALHCPQDEAAEDFVLYATYKTRMRRTDDGWKIQRHQLVPRATLRNPANTNR